MRFPPDFTYPAQKTKTAALAAQCIAGLASDHRVVVQAGGCSGLWPLALAAHFAHVYTYEPAPANFACLVENIAGTPNITAFPYALGDTARTVGLTRPKVGAGLWRVDGDGETPMRPLDDLQMAHVDALVLDVEGSELPALQGAEDVIATSRPLLWFECLHHTAALASWVVAHGYTQPVPALGGDCYSVHVSRVA